MPKSRGTRAGNSHRRKGNSDKVGSGQLGFMIINLLSTHSDKAYTPKQVQSKLGVANTIEAVKDALLKLERQGALQILEDGRVRFKRGYIIEDRGTHRIEKEVQGRVDMTRSGAAYLILEQSEVDVYISSRYTNTAMHGDIVKAVLFNDRGRRKPEGKITEVVKRATTHVIGTLRIFDKYSVVYPILMGSFPEVIVKQPYLNDAEDGQPVLVEIVQWGQSQNKNIWGRITQVLHEMTPHDMAMEAILLSNGFQTEYPQAAVEESEAISALITAEEIAKRRDFRDILTFTIDPDTAKDFDDAISYRIVENEHIEIGVHIADVTHYLNENTALDKEAYNRSTSVYLVDRLVPMLPERLSNDLCSLNPHEDKLTFSAVFTFDETFKIIDRWFGKTIIHSARRFTYEEAQERLESGVGDLAEELRKVNSLASKLRKDRFKKGAINFESDEVKFVLDEHNKPIGVYAKERKEAHMLIEDFMLLANKEVATYIFKKTKPEIPSVYRVHDLPDLDRLADFGLFAKSMGYTISLDNPDKIAQSLNALTKASEKDDSLKVLLPLAIRTMSKAEYTTNNIGHYGLAFEFYTHFTSPIRRYSDVLVHRILFENLGQENVKRDQEILEQRCKYISKQERKATDAERESVKYKQVEYMLEKEGQIFNGIISGMIDKGIFVEVIESKAEGLIPFKKLGEEYEVSSSRLQAVSKRTGHILKMGSKVTIRLDDANLDTRLLEFSLMEVQE